LHCLCLSHGLASWAGIALNLLEFQLAGDLDFRAKTAAGGDQTVTHGWWAEAESSLCLGTVLEGVSGVTAETTVLIAIQLG